jgi:hypothetical protein
MSNLPVSISGFGEIAEKTYTISQFLAEILSVLISPNVPLSPKLPNIALF